MTGWHSLIQILSRGINIFYIKCFLMKKYVFKMLYLNNKKYLKVQSGRIGLSILVRLFSAVSVSFVMHFSDSMIGNINQDSSFAEQNLY
jgi:hypothetical protein